MVLPGLGSLPRHALLIEQRLNPIECLRVDQRLLTPGENLLRGCSSEVDNIAAVEAVALATASRTEVPSGTGAGQRREMEFPR